MMTRASMSLILIVAACCGCETEKRDSSADSRHAQQGPGTQTSLEPSADLSPESGNAENPARALTSPSFDQDQYTAFPAAGVKLIRPDGFDDAERFYGFQQPSTHSSVMAVMVPGRFSEVTGGFTAEQLKSHAMTLESKEDVTIDGYSGVLVRITQTAYGTDFSKWILAFGDEQETRMVTATFPKYDEATLSAQLKAVVLAARVDSTPPPAPGADVGFTIADSEKMRITPSGLGKMLIYTKDGVMPTASPEDPSLVAAPSLSEIRVTDEREFAVQRILQTAPHKVTSVISTDSITIDGLDGYELEATAEHAKSGILLVVYQVVLFEENSYILLVGVVGAELRDEYLPEFKAMARSLKRQRR